MGACKKAAYEVEELLLDVRKEISDGRYDDSVDSFLLLRHLVSEGSLLRVEVGAVETMLLEAGVLEE